MNNRIGYLDALRGMASVMVMLSHVSHLKLDGTQAAQIQWMVPFLEGGRVGVPIFFVLSGYLVGKVLMNELQASGGISLARFWLRRGFKIYPLFYLAVALCLAYLWLVEGRLDRERMLREIFFLQNYGKGGLLDVTWSLAVEEHFYFVLPVVLLLIARWKQRNGRAVQNWWHELRFPLTAITVCLTVVCLWFRWSATAEPGFPLISIYGTHLRVDGLFAGVATCAVMAENSALQNLVRRHAAVITIVALGTIFSAGSLYVHAGWRFCSTFYLVLLSAASAALVAVAVSVPLRQGWLESLLRFFGRHSYAIYLFHIPVYRVANKLNEKTNHFTPGMVMILACFVAAILAGVVLTMLVERPFLALRDRWVPGPCKTMKPSACPTAV